MGLRALFVISNAFCHSRIALKGLYYCQAVEELLYKWDVSFKRE